MSASARPGGIANMVEQWRKFLKKILVLHSILVPQWKIKTITIPAISYRHRMEWLHKKNGMALRWKSSHIYTRLHGGAHVEITQEGWPRCTATGLGAGGEIISYRNRVLTGAEFYFNQSHHFSSLLPALPTQLFWPSNFLFCFWERSLCFLQCNSLGHYFK